MQYRLKCAQRHDQQVLVEKQMQAPLPIVDSPPIPIPEHVPCVEVDEKPELEEEEEFKPCPLTSRIRPVTSNQVNQFMYGMKN